MQKGELEILTKSKQELIQLMPLNDQAQDLENHPTSISISDALSTVDDSQKRIIDILSEATQSISNLNIMD
jgi:hypothetical protein